MAASSAVPAQQPAPDPVARLLTSLETALASGVPTRLTDLELPTLAPDVVNGIARAVVGGPDAAAVVRERSRRVAASGTDVLADVFLGHGAAARVVTWHLHLQPAADGRLLIAGVDEQGALDNLVKLTLDATHEFAVHNFAFRGIDFTLTLASGSAFLAQVDHGVTAIVLRGNGHVYFAPPDRAEQGQLEIFAHQAQLSAETTDAFIRLSPAEFASRVGEGTLEPEPVGRDDLAAARQIYDEFSPQTYGVDLRDLGERGWSFEPTPGNVVVEFKAGRLGWLTYARSPTDFEDVTLFKRSAAKLISSYVSAERLATRGRFYSDSADAAYHLDHVDLDVALNPVSSTIHGHATLRVHVLSDQVSSLTFRLSDDLIVSSVTAPGAERLLAVRLTGQNRILVTLPQSIPRGTPVALEIAYAGRLAPGPLDREALDELPQQMVDDFRPEPEHVWIYSGRTAWYPQPEALDHATATLRVRVPAEFQVAASGALTRSSESAATSSAPALRTSEFLADRPVRYLACVISRFTTVSTTSVTVAGVAPVGAGWGRPPRSGPAALDVTVLSTPQSVNAAKSLGTRAADILKFYAGLMGEAPYPSFTLAAIDDNVPGGHSPAYLTILRERLPTSTILWRADPVAFDRVPQFLLAHEIAHEWWGQAVSWKNYHEQWLSEGLAQYSAVLYTGSVLGPGTAHDLLAEMKSAVLDLENPGPIALGYRLGHLSNRPTVYRVIVYNKSALVLDMLRRLIGDQAFYAGLSRFYRENRFAPAGTDDLIRAFESESSVKLDHFFDTWVFGSAIPDARVETNVDAGSHSATVHVETTGVEADFPVTIGVEYADGTSEDVTIPVFGGRANQQIPLRGPVRRLTAKGDTTLVRFRN